MKSQYSSEQTATQDIPCMEAKSNRRIIGFAVTFCKKSATWSGISGRMRWSASETVRSCCAGRYKLMPVCRLTSNPIFNSPGPGKF